MRLAVVLACVLLVGCAHRGKPRWEVQVTIGVLTKPEPNTTTSASVTMKRLPLDKHGAMW